VVLLPARVPLGEPECLTVLLPANQGYGGDRLPHGCPLPRTKLLQKNRLELACPGHRPFTASSTDSRTASTVGESWFGPGLASWLSPNQLHFWPLLANARSSRLFSLDRSTPGRAALYSTRHGLRQLAMDGSLHKLCY